MTQDSYKWGAMSPNDPTPVPLKFHTKEQAQHHADNMNALLETWETNPIWNKNHWKVKPQPWTIMELKHDTR